MLKTMTVTSHWIAGYRVTTSILPKIVSQLHAQGRILPSCLSFYSLTGLNGMEGQHVKCLVHIGLQCLITEYHTSWSNVDYCNCGCIWATSIASISVVFKFAVLAKNIKVLLIFQSSGICSWTAKKQMPGQLQLNVLNS